jgi:hypothetical protein
MDNEILEIIKKNIPQQTADVLKEYLEQAKKDKEALARALRDIVTYQQTHTKMEVEIKSLKGELDSFLRKETSLKEREEFLNSREATLYKCELEKQVFELQCQRSAQQQIIERDLHIMNTVFRNPKFIDTTKTTESIPVVVKDRYDNGHERVEQHYQSKEVTVEKTIE